MLVSKQSNRNLLKHIFNRKYFKQDAWKAILPCGCLLCEATLQSVVAMVFNRSASNSYLLQ